MSKKSHYRSENVVRFKQAGSQLVEIRASLADIGRRLAILESKDLADPISPFIAHPSKERFGVSEGIVVGMLGRLNDDKNCEYEPTVRPCDHCSMCSARGY